MPWLEKERAEVARLDKLNNFRRHKKSRRFTHVKLGHGGTLDPMATGVLIVGVGSGTKQLPSFLKCTKTYETTILFGAATNTYDVMGRVLAKAPYSHITRELVEDALAAFRGEIMQRPPIYSALRMDGKRLYQYAREGKEIPKEIQERPMEVKELEIVEWLEASDHDYKWPSDEAAHDEKVLAKQLFDVEVSSNPAATLDSDNQGEKPLQSLGKRKRIIDEDDDLVKSKTPSKRKEEDPSVCMSGALQISNEESNEEAPTTIEDHESSLANTEQSSTSSPPQKGPPAVKVRMTVTSGFYVRSFSHDLGKKVGSLAMMSELVRTRQGDFRLGQNVLEYEDIGKGEECWGPKVERLLYEWDKDGSEPSEEDPSKPDIT